MSKECYICEKEKVNLCRSCMNSICEDHYERVWVRNSIRGDMMGYDYCPMCYAKDEIQDLEKKHHVECGDM